MKKILAAFLCLIPLFCWGFAEGFVPVGTKDCPWAEYAGESIRIPVDCFALASGESLPQSVEFSGEYFTVSSHIAEGQELVASVSLVGDSRSGRVLQIRLKKTANQKGSARLVFSELALTAKKTVQDSSGRILLEKGSTYYFNQTGKFYAQINQPYR